MLFKGRRESFAAAFKRERQVEHISCGVWGGTLLARAQEKKSPALAYEACIEDFASTTTIQGIPKLADKKNGPVRLLIWLTAFCGFGYLCFSQIIPLVSRFQERATVTTSSIVASSTGFFPSVIVCPSAPHFRCDCKLFSASPELSAYTKSLRCHNATFDYVGGPDPCGVAVSGFDYDMMLAQFEELGYLRERDLSYYAAFTYQDAFVYWKFGEFTAGHPEADNLWRLIYDPSLGYSCWSFNPTHAARQRRPVELDGFFCIYDMKLELQSKLFREQSINGGDEEGRTGWMGLDVGLQNSPQGSLQLFQTTVGLGTVVSLKRQDTVFLNSYGKSNCQDNVNSSLEVCINNCLWEAGAAQCGCANGDVGKCPTYFLSENLTTPEGQQLIDCILDDAGNATYYNQYAEGLICRPFLDCEQPCFVSDVVPSVSSYPWPQQSLGEETAQFLSTNLQREISLASVQTNMLQMRIFASSFTYQISQEVPALLVGDLLGAVGGNLGLWAGFSFLTLIEIFELICVMFLLGVTFCCRRGTTQQVVNHVDNQVGHPGKDKMVVNDDDA